MYNLQRYKKYHHFDQFFFIISTEADRRSGEILKK